MLTLQSSNKPKHDSRISVLIGSRLGNVTRARMTQIMNLLMLAPEIQEELLFCRGCRKGGGRSVWGELQAVAGVVEWEGQRDCIEDTSNNCCCYPHSAFGNFRCRSMIVWPRQQLTHQYYAAENHPNQCRCMARRNFGSTGVSEKITLSISQYGQRAVRSSSGEALGSVIHSVTSPEANVRPQ